jgi:hypothetical protein
MIISLDFDGTCVTHEFPKVGKDIGAIPVIKELINNGHKIILFTMRSNFEGEKYLTEAYNWFYENDIILYGVNKNPTQHRWTTSPKVFADLYIGDDGLGIPLIHNKEISKNPFVNWIKTKQLLIDKGIIK